MTEVRRNVIIPYTAKQMFNLVADIENYPKYLPWCSEAKIKDQTANEVIGAVYIEYLKIKTHFVTKNINTPYSRIEMQLLEGPFKHLYGNWDFAVLGEIGCKIEFTLNYQFTNVMLEKLIGPVFSYIAKHMVDNFIQEAHSKYGNSPQLKKK